MSVERFWCYRRLICERKGVEKIPSVVSSSNPGFNNERLPKFRWLLHILLHFTTCSDSWHTDFARLVYVLFERGREWCVLEYTESRERDERFSISLYAHTHSYEGCVTVARNAFLHDSRIEFEISVIISLFRTRRGRYMWFFVVHVELSASGPEEELKTPWLNWHSRLSS